MNEMKEALKDLKELMWWILSMMPVLWWRTWYHLMWWWVAAAQRREEEWAEMEEMARVRWANARASMSDDRDDW